MKVCAALTVHNRRDMTLACLGSLADQHLADGVGVDVCLFDDGSTDGTGEAVRTAHPDVEVIDGDGSFFWNGGMRVAIGAATSRDPDFLLWVNDDTVLGATAVQTLLDTHARLEERGRGPAVVVATVVDPQTRAVNYSGVVQDRWRRMWFKTVSSDVEPVQADTMNGNCVLIPRAVYRAVGNLDPGYTHAMGDYDYGLRVRQAGFGVWVAPGVLATCPSNPGFVPDGSGVREELNRLQGTKHLPPREWQLFVRRWGGPAWRLYWAFPYLRRLGWIVRRRIQRA